MHPIFYGLQNYESKQQTLTGVTGKNVSLSQDYMHSKLSMAPTFDAHRGISSCKAVT